MGGSTYSFSSRSVREENLGYKTKSVNQIFTQNLARKIHESMSPKGIVIRESRDSATHPFSVPILLGLDITGSMGHIPHQLIKTGLPKMMAGIMERGVPDPQVLFLPVGDHEYDSYPLQVGQFESGDAELDMWLTRTFIESGGGGNGGESYLLSWYFAAFHTVTDSWEKRKKKGFLFTVGDEPCLRSLPATAIREIMGDSAKAEKSYSAEELLKLAQEKWNVFHINARDGAYGTNPEIGWKGLLGQHLIGVDNHEDIPRVIAEIVSQNSDSTPPTEAVAATIDEIKQSPKITL